MALWGIYHGVGLVASNTAARYIGPAPSFGVRPGFAIMTNVASRFATVLFVLFVLFGWLLFFYPADRAWRMFTLLFGH